MYHDFPHIIAKVIVSGKICNASMDPWSSIPDAMISVADNDVIACKVSLRFRFLARLLGESEFSL